MYWTTLNHLFVAIVCIVSFNHQIQCNGDLSESVQPVSPLRRLLQANNNNYNNNHKNSRTFNYLFNRCNNQQKEWMTQCEIDAAEDWDIAQTPNDISSRSFCCYIWDQLRCKLKTAWTCDTYYAEQLERDTEAQYNSVCHYHSRRSASCALRWWMIMLIVVGGLIIIALVAFCCWRTYRNKYTSKYDY